MKIDDLLGQAYALDQIAHNRIAAIKLIRDALAADHSANELLRQRAVHLNAVRAARRFGDRDGCHVTAVLSEILNQAIY